MQIIVDNREPDANVLLFKTMTDLSPVKMSITEQTAYPTGDYVWKNALKEGMVERKTIGDFISSVEDESVFDQCQRMAEWMQEDNSRFACIIIVGKIDKTDKYLKMPLVARLGAMFDIMMRYGILIINVMDELQFVIGVNKLVKSHAEGKMGIARPFSVQSANKLTYLQHCVGGLKGIGPKNMDTIIEGMEAENLVDWITKLEKYDLTELDGIGPKRDESIKKEVGYGE